jgi:hypothetical protein
MRKLWRVARVGVTAVTLAAGLAVTATPAGATTQAPAQVTPSPRHVITAASRTTARNYRGGWFTVTYCDDQYYRYGCTIGSSGDLFGSLYAANGCATRVVMYAPTAMIFASAHISRRTVSIETITSTTYAAAPVDVLRLESIDRIGKGHSYD